MGLMRFYGAPDHVQDVTTWLDRPPLRVITGRVEASQ
jgi:hypothetical protein